MSFSFLLQLLAARPASRCSANNPAVGIYLDRYNPLFSTCEFIVLNCKKKKKEKKKERNVPILLDTLYK